MVSSWKRAAAVGLSGFCESETGQGRSCETKRVERTHTVRVDLERFLAVGFADVGGGGRKVEPQQGVVVNLVVHCAVQEVASRRMSWVRSRRSSEVWSPRGSKTSRSRGSRRVYGRV